MLGHKLFDYFKKQSGHTIIGTVKDKRDSLFVNNTEQSKIYSGIEALEPQNVLDIIAEISPDILINCIGIIKQKEQSKKLDLSIKINSLFPRQIGLFCSSNKIRFIHFSTDCVFSGKLGNYNELFLPDASDYYGLSKYLGEVYAKNCLTIRTSIVGHELYSKNGLVEWFLSQEGKVNGYTNAIFSGFPTVEIARILNEYIIPDKNIFGLYHVSSEPVSKYDLLKIISEKYNKRIIIDPFDKIWENRSLNSDKFKNKTGFKTKNWEQLINEMHTDYLTSEYYRRQV